MFFKGKHLVREVLQSFPKSRDDDFHLITNIIRKHEGENLDFISGNTLISNMLQGKYGAFESITRARRKWQERFPHLRGEKYQDRQAYARQYSQMTFWDMIGFS